MPLMAHMLAALTWTVDARVGLFGDAAPTPALAAALVAPRHPPAPAALFSSVAHGGEGRAGADARTRHAQTLLAHATGRAFLCDRWQVLRTMGDAPMRALMQRTLLHALHDPAAMSRHPLAVGPTFRLLLLTLQVVLDEDGGLDVSGGDGGGGGGGGGSGHGAAHAEGGEGKGGGRETAAALIRLRDDALTAALWWFSDMPSWMTMDDAILEEAVLALEGFGALMGGGRLEGLRAREKDSVDAAAAREKSTAAGAGAGGVGGGGCDAAKGSAQVRRECALLAALTAHEAARLRLWANPVETERQYANTMQVRRVPECPLLRTPADRQRLPCERHSPGKIFTAAGWIYGVGFVDISLQAKLAQMKRKMKHKTKRQPPAAAYRAPKADSWWNEHVSAVWTTVPAAALALAKRFPEVACVPKILTRLVLRDAHLPSVQALPAALPFLATPDAVRRNAPQLRHVTDWAVMSLADTLALLAPAVAAHEAVAAYTRRALDSHPPDTVAFFLPQLVQVRWLACVYFDWYAEYMYLGCRAVNVTWSQSQNQFHT